MGVNSFAMEGRHCREEEWEVFLLIAGIKDMLKPDNHFGGSNFSCNAPLNLRKHRGCMSARVASVT